MVGGWVNKLVMVPSDRRFFGRSSHSITGNLKLSSFNRLLYERK